MSAPTARRRRAPESQVPVLRVERDYRPDLARQVRALLLLLEMRAADPAQDGAAARGGEVHDDDGVARHSSPR